jgi:hypothetical protein
MEGIQLPAALALLLLLGADLAGTRERGAVRDFIGVSDVLKIGREISA